VRVDDDYAADNSNDSLPRALRDVFLSHASPDKDTYVRPLACSLEDRDISYWLDEAELLWGHSLLKTISEGLEAARFVLVFISEHFISRPWPDAELRAALSREISSGEIRVLPLFICEPEHALAKYPFLRDKKWLTWQDGIPTVVSALEGVLGRTYQSSWTFGHPALYRGNVWIKVLPRLENVGTLHDFRVNWGRWCYEGSVRFSTHSAHVLNFRKIAEQETYPIVFQISPPAFVSAGKGRVVHDINHGWKCVDKKGIVRAMIRKARQVLSPDSEMGDVDRMG